jgi:hypothetical protein
MDHLEAILRPPKSGDTKAASKLHHADFFSSTTNKTNKKYRA